jgi:hypothetical protein
MDVGTTTPTAAGLAASGSLSSAALFTEEVTS